LEEEKTQLSNTQDELEHIKNYVTEVLKEVRKAKNRC
jgi:hypothetical protein